MNDKRLQEIKDSIDFQREILIAHNINTLCVDEEQELYDYVINLQSKIDKAIEYLDEVGMQFDNETAYYINEYPQWIKLKNILKEDK